MRDCKAIVMLKEVKHLAVINEITWRCFTMFNMTMYFADIHRIPRVI